MKILPQVISLICMNARLGSTPALAREWTLLDSSRAPQNWQITSLELGAFSVSLRTLRGGHQEAVQQISPFNAKAAAGSNNWQNYQGLTRDDDETVYNLVSYGDKQGNTLAVLNNSAGTPGGQC